MSRLARALAWALSFAALILVAVVALWTLLIVLSPWP